ncbi:MAG: AraC family transcriptional regulator [Methylococcus sp.]|nr:AraC family transcriptional regulator [Methylococcus sp.]
MNYQTVFCSSVVPEKERLDAWDATVKEGLALEMVHTDPRPFFCRVEELSLGPVTVYQTRITAHTSCRTPQLIKSHDFDGFCLHINQNGRSETLRQRDRTVVDSLGATGYTYGQPFSVSLLPTGDDYHQSINLIIPRTALTKKVPNAERRIAQCHKNLGVLSLLTGYLELLKHNPLTADDFSVRELIGQHVIDLITLLLGANSDTEYEAHQGGLRSARLAALKKYLEENHHRPNLSVPAAAKAMKISERYLQDLMAETGESFTETICRLRLEQAQQMLGNPKYRHLRISEIAFNAGFSDISYFCRLFRRRFGDSPSGYRIMEASSGISNRAGAK